VWRDCDGPIHCGGGLRGFGEKKVDRSTLSPYDALNDNVEHARAGLRGWTSVEVCALCAIRVGLGGVLVGFLVLERRGAADGDGLSEKSLKGPFSGVGMPITGA
jgi:hypothetical protein